MKVLVIEDNPTDSKLVSHLLASEGHEVNNATGAVEAMEQLMQSLPDIVLLDLKLPGINGIMFTEQLKSDERFKAIPILAVTAYPNTWSKYHADNAGCDDLLIKPIDTRTIIQKMVSILEGK